MVNVITSLVLQFYFPLKSTGVFRSEDAGLWCACLLPVIATNLGSPDAFMTLTLVPVTFLQYLLSQSRSLVRDGAVGIMLVYMYCLTTSLGISVFGITSCVLHFAMLYKIPQVFKASFTFGEASLVSQLLTYFYHNIVQFLLKNTSSAEPLDVLVGIVSVSVVAIVTLLWVLQRKRWSVHYQVILIGLVTAGGVIGATQKFIGLARMVDMILDLLWTKCSILLLLYWVFCTVLSIGVVCYYGNQSDDEKSYSEGSSKQIEAQYGKISNVSDGGTMDTRDEQYKIRSANTLNKKKEEKGEITGDKSVTTAVRKYFHVAMLCVYVPGLLYNQGLLYFVSAAALGLLVLIEVIRVLDYPVVGVVIDSYLRVFVDQQDPGDLILTPIYLLVGCSLPLWIGPTHTDQGGCLLLYAGLVTVGVGDGAASIVGRRWGSIKWPGSSKSVQGTCAAVISQLVAIHLLGYCGVADASVSMATVICVILISCLEAFTSQIDNLVVPVFGLMMLSSTSSIASYSPT